MWEERCRHLCTDTFRFFAVWRDGRPVALATTFLGELGAVLGNAYTREDDRGRGLHRALLAARLADAARRGIPHVVTDVEPDTTSHRNCERAGFTVVREQEIWERPPVAPVAGPEPASP